MRACVRCCLCVMCRAVSWCIVRGSCDIFHAGAIFRERCQRRGQGPRRVCQRMRQSLGWVRPLNWLLAPVYLLAYLPACLPTCLPAYLPACLGVGRGWLSHLTTRRSRSCSCSPRQCLPCATAAVAARSTRQRLAQRRHHPGDQLGVPW